jgi:hypothetical protein
LISPRWIRRIVLAVCVAAIGGMIAASITSHNGLAIAAGLTAAIAIVCLILVTAVAGPEAFGAAPAIDEAAAADLEERVLTLVANGADEAEVRALVRAAHRLSRRMTSQ